jgi:hypothetical protein
MYLAQLIQMIGDLRDLPEKTGLGYQGQGTGNFISFIFSVILYISYALTAGL